MWLHMSIYPRSEVMGHGKLPCLKYYNALMRKFILGLNIAKNTDYIEKGFKQKLFRIKFYTKKSMDTYVYINQEWS